MVVEVEVWFGLVLVRGQWFVRPGRSASVVVLHYPCLWGESEVGGICGSAAGVRQRKRK